jgi:hypothetical protein
VAPAISSSRQATARAAPSSLHGPLRVDLKAHGRAAVHVGRNPVHAGGDLAAADREIDHGSLAGVRADAHAAPRQHSGHALRMGIDAALGRHLAGEFIRSKCDTDQAHQQDEGNDPSAEEVRDRPPSTPHDRKIAGQRKSVRRLTTRAGRR